MMQRSREEIIPLLLQSAEKGATQTTLMYETYLSHDGLKGYLTLLLEKGLLEYLAGEMKFKTTAKGLAFLSSKIGSGDKTCSHQCKKCGVLYCCRQTNCKDPFHHSICNQCLHFLGRHDAYNVIDDVQGIIPLHRTRPTIAGYDCIMHP